MSERWLWPSSDEVNDFPDPLGFEDEWKPWAGSMREGPSRFAEIFCREHFQNSWDSIQERIAEAEEAEAPMPAGYGVTYRFVKLEGAEAVAFAEALGLEEHATRLGSMSEKDRKGARLDDSYAARGDFSALNVLVATESFGEGMFGPWHTGGRAGVVSRLKSALIQTRSAKDNQAAGGSWGHGKKAIANASACRTIAVYTCSLPRTDDLAADGSPVTRRLLGVSYWRAHDIGENSHVGLGLLGQRVGDTGGYSRFRPFENGEADTLVQALGLPGLEVRSPDLDSQTGSSYLVVEPEFTPEDLAMAIERNWWPLLLRQPTVVEVIGYDGAPVQVSPHGRTELMPFLQAHSLAMDEVTGRERGDLAMVVNSAKVDDATSQPVGRLGLTSDDSMGGWSWEDPDENWSLIALIRNDMVIAYQRLAKRRVKAPFIRGVFVVDRKDHAEASERLKMSEPHLHNVWHTERSPSVPDYAAKLAADATAKIRDRVTALRKSLLEKDTSATADFAEFSRLFDVGPKVVRGPSRKDIVGPRGNRGVSIRYLWTKLDGNIANPERLRLMCRISVTLSQAALRKWAEHEVRVDLGWGVLEEAGPVRDHRLTDHDVIELPPGFGVQGNLLVGTISATPVEFEWHSGFFSDDWQVVPYPQVSDPLAEAAAATQGAAVAS